MNRCARPMTRAPPRRCGLEPPLAMQQVLALVAYVAATALCFWVEARRELQASVAVAAAIVLFCFLHVSLVDPAQDATGLEKRCVAAFYPFRPEASRSHYLNRASYCAQCRKCVWGLDHHCPWLNTCIGRRNYPTFFALGVFGRAVVKSGSRRRRDVGLSEGSRRRRDMGLRVAAAPRR